MTASAQTPSDPAHLRDLGDLQTLRDRGRPLLIFAADSSDPHLQTQLRILREHAAEAAERDLIPIALPATGPSTTPTTLSSAGATRLRQRFHISPAAFAVILIGKDGGEKLRSAVPLSIEILNRTIDAMPMRQDEMRTRPGP